MCKYAISRLLFLFLFTCFHFSNALAQTQEELPVSPFTPTKWNKSVDLIEYKLASTDWTAEKVNSTLSVLADLQRNAKQCIRYSQSELDRINQAVTLPLVGNASTSQQLAAASLNGREVELNDLRAECRLFLLHSQDVYSQIEKLQQHLIASRIFTRGPTLVENIHNLPSLKVLADSVDMASLQQKLGLPYFTQISFMVMGFLVIVCAGIAYAFKKYSVKKLSQTKKNYFYHTVIAFFAQYPYLLTYSLVFSIYFAFFSWPHFFLIPGQINIFILGYLLLLAMIRVVFYPLQNSKPLIALPEPIPQELNLRLFYLLTLVLVYYSCGSLVRGQNLPVTVYELGMTLYLSALSVIVINIVWLITRFPKVLALNKYARRALNIGFTSLLALVLISECFGYHYFSIFLIKNIVVSFIIICVAMALQMVTFTQISRLKANQYIRYHLAIRFHRGIPELDILQAVILIVIWGAALAFLLRSWALSESYYSQLITALREGFTVTGITLIPSRIITGMLIFVLFALSNRLLQAYVGRHSRYYIEEGTQVATASIVGYIGFALAVIISLMIAGVNFTGLAIIAGALSVGIGFGLQNIANNFISGLILLLDNPIRPGDRIQVGDVEGIVKRIRLRATHIYTMRHADVFIPNSELVSKSVTNFVFHDKTWSIICSVGVEYGCDINKVRELLMNVALKHPEVIQEKDKSPQVFFKKFGDSSLLFELWCLIHDIGQKNHIESDLNSAIYHAFQEAGINIPFPQQELHIKEWPEKPTKA